MRVLWMAALLAAAPAAGAGAAETPAPPAGTTTVLDQKDYWRKHYTFFPPRLSVRAAKAAGVETDLASRETYLARFYHSGFRTPAPPAGWTQPDFDDGDWLLRRGREFVVGDRRLMPRGRPRATSTFLRGTDPFVEEVGLICQRGSFRVADPSKVRRLTLALTCRGGFVAYLNGREVARAHLPEGKLAFDTPSADYPLEAFFTAESIKAGKPVPLHAFNHRRTGRWGLRERTTGPVTIDPSLLRKGVNVLAVELHRADYPAECRRKDINWRTARSLGFATVGLGLVSLVAEGADGAASAPHAGPPAGPIAWTADVHRPMSEAACPNHDERLAPVRIVAARNGRFSGRVMVAAAGGVDGPSATAGALTAKGGARIPASAVRVRYEAGNPLWGGGMSYRTAVVPRAADDAGGLGRRLDLLLDSPPAAGPSGGAAPAAVGVWVTVDVPEDAAPGEYTGALTVGAGGRTLRAPVELSVADWALPDVADYASLINIYQSPDTLARHYRLTPWSKRHWAMIERSLKLMGRAGNIGLFVPLLAESQMGNPESMVVWVPRGESYRYDFSRFDRYIDTAMQHHTRLRFIALNVWGYTCRGRKGADPYGAQVTVLDPATGAMRNVKLPEYGTEACERLWRPLLLAIRDRLEQRGLADRILLGLPADGSPHWRHVAMFRRILPETAWVRESHFDIRGFRYDSEDKSAVVPVAYNSIVWGGGVPDPAEKRLYGWRVNPNHIVMTFNRAGASALNLHGFAPPWSFRVWMESTLAGGRNGNGRVGGDYWRIGMRPRGPGRVSSEAGGGCGGTLYGSYLPSSVGQVGLGNSTTDLFGPGPDGPVPTVRFANALEGNQQAEARIAIEKALLDKDRPLPEALAARCRRLLDERTMVLRMMAVGAGEIAPYGWRERAKRLFDAAGEVRRARPPGE